MEKKQKSKIVFSTKTSGLIKIESIYGNGSIPNKTVKNVRTSVGINSFPTASFELIASSEYPNLLSIKTGDEVSIYAGETNQQLNKIFQGILRTVKLTATKESAKLNIESVSPFYLLQERKVSSVNFKIKNGLREFFKELISVCDINGEVEFDNNIDNEFNINSFKSFPALSLINSICYERDLAYDFNSGEVMTISKRTSIREEIFFNETLAQDEITQLLAPKVLTNAKVFDKDGEHGFSSFHRDAEFNRKRGLPKDTITDNLIVKGNNLLALHSIKKEFVGKVKLIYIDPPYNTGNDGFKYNDNFNHSTWLTFMKNRMEVARELLREDGVIFVSCDNHEFAHLKILMNEIFGDKNFLTLFTWETKKGSQGMITKHKVVNNHEYLVVFARNKDTFSFKGLERNEMNFTNSDNDHRGKWKRQYLQRFGQGFSQKTIINPQNGMKFTFETPYSKQKLETWIKDNRIIFPENSNKYPAKKEFLNEYKNREQLVSSLGLYSTKSNTEELYKLFDNEKVFRNPKPEKLLYFIIEQSTQVGDIVLDYHLGSGTTAAVAHKMERQYIGIEQMDYIETISVERMKKVIEGEQRGISKSVNWQGGGSFTYFELKKHNQNFIEQIEIAKDTKTLLKVWEEMKKESFLNYNLDIQKYNPQNGMCSYLNWNVLKNGISNSLSIG